MSAITIYLEGGGDQKASRRKLRLGMDKFLGEIKDLARKNSWEWKLVCCGPRTEAIRSFRNAYDNPDGTLTVLLVDAEGPVGTTPRAHLAATAGRNLNRIPEEVLHLMVQQMESWIVAARDALAAYYGQGFARNAVPAAADLETVAKADIERALNRATRDTRKGRYKKIEHGSELLERISSATVQTRCRHCRRLFDTLRRLVTERWRLATYACGDRIGNRDAFP